MGLYKLAFPEQPTTLKLHGFRYFSGQLGRAQVGGSADLGLLLHLRPGAGWGALPSRLRILAFSCGLPPAFDTVARFQEQQDGELQRVSLVRVPAPATFAVFPVPSGTHGQGRAGCGKRCHREQPEQAGDGWGRCCRQPSARRAVGWNHTQCSEHGASAVSAGGGPRSKRTENIGRSCRSGVRAKGSGVLGGSRRVGQSPRGLDGIEQMMLGVLVSEQKSGRCGYGSEWLERPEVLTGIEGA